MLAFLLSAKFALCEDFNNIRIYQVMVSSFQDGDPNLGYGTGYGPSDHRGDLRGIINALDYIKGLGVNALWMTPIFDSSNGQGGALLQSTGYFCTNYFKIDPKFGDDATFRELVDKCHKKGMYVFLDGVFGHHGGVTTASPSGKWPQGGNNPVSYPGSLDFYKEVAKYWIENYGIDGWRLDQCYQMYQNNYNYLKEIRQAVEEACNARKQRGEKWGTLGYIVGENWRSASEIQQQTYSGDGIRSAFDFPSRYSLVRTVAMEESGASSYVQELGNIFKTNSEKGYYGQVYPNLFISNHDVWRFGNLIKNKYGYGKSSQDYWKRHKIAMALLASYTGPITIYYGDEIGDLAECWTGSNPSCGSNTYSDNVARTNGQITGFNSDQQSLHDYTSKLMFARAENPAMWRGTSGISYDGGVMFNCKYDDQTKNKVVMVVNLGLDSRTVTYNVGGSKLTDLVTGKIINGNNGSYQIQIEALGSAVYKVE
ncbi:Alpha amylase, catalytic domain containing protein [Trichomonas vaginalis G3]|uniref:Alpha amylase, catalytic domain containing protein n=1 Tax=Trichomonas vaginalis (strain ATCC PRA-98 / G3) TaxID=412133 RepID=A2EKB4_TRIV3|nr:maltodextrin glucosidase family [Trichomonas vaginalis G3]EAY06912.1 Alpha amylase, catalytic domain containing protein [Trichomonas vaginalis G3]KAI5513923.1 maltodextrin glucosidase family [Trichomonas vaginalis G3]|eukprot:XP_001319135.1 Alpha amylase, catalytic domain containing protein [Trichomonas vaginalis G3]